MSETSANVKRGIKLGEAMFIVIGIVIGSGVFFKPTAVLSAVGGAPGLAIAAWVVGAIITIAGALSIAEIASAMPRAGGLMTYLKDLYGDVFYFLLGWVQLLVYYPGIAAALAVVFATQCTALIPLTPVAQKVVAVGFILFLTTMNIISAQFATKFSVLSTIAKLVPIAVIIVFGLAMGSSHSFTPMTTAASSAAGFGTALLGVLFAYEGWVNVTNVGNELVNPAKDLPKSIILGLTLVTIVYLGVNIAIFNTMSVDAIVGSKKAATDAAVILFGNSGSMLIAIGILISLLGCVGTFLMTASRLPLVMAQDKLFPAPKLFSKVTNGVPTNGLILEAVLAIIYAISGSFDMLTNISVFAIWMFLLLGIVGVFVLRKKYPELTKKEGQYKVPLYPVLPLIGVVGAGYILLNTLITSTSNALVGIAVVAIGIPVYIYLKKHQ